MVGLNNTLHLQAHSPYYGPLMALVNVVHNHSRMGIDSDAYIFRPLKKYWSRIIRHVSCSLI